MVIKPETDRNNSEHGNRPQALFAAQQWCKAHGERAGRS